MEVKMDPQYDIAKHLVNTTYENIPPKAVNVAKLEILDSLGAALAGSSRDMTQIMTDVFKEFGSKGRSSVITRGIKFSPIDAASVNSVMMAALDFDDVVDFAPNHPSILIVPVCLALSEHKGKVSGKEFITAVALGDDLLIRLSLGARYNNLVERTLAIGGALYGHMIASALSGKILGFSEDEMVEALGSAYHQSSNMVPGTFGGNLKGSTFPIRGGMLAALMVRKGIRIGERECIEGKRGLYNHFHPGRYDREALLGGLGKNYLGVDVTIKPYPACRITHSFITAAISLAKEHDIRPEQIIEIDVIGNAVGYSLSIPIEEKRSPQTQVASQFSVPWCVAAALARRKASINEFTNEAIKDPVILEVAKKIKVEQDPGVTGALGARVTVKTKGGIYTKHVDTPPGGPSHQLSFTDCANKFRDCASYSFKPLTKETIERIIKRVEKLEDVDDIAEIITEVS
jgi:2-methylcitrate dehydratase PrpD